MILFSDIDGTLLDFNEEVSPGVKDAIKSWLDAGHKFHLISGRSVDSVWRVGRMLGLENHTSCASNGAILADFTEHGYEVRSSADYGKLEILNAIVSVDDHSNIRFEDHYSQTYKIVETENDPGIWGDNILADAKDLHTKGIVSIHVRVPDDFDYKDEHTYEYNGARWVHQARKHVNKGIHIPNLVSPEFFRQGGRVPVFGVGDEYNDIPMFDAVDNFYLMGNSSKSVIEWSARRGGVLIPRVEYGGVANLIDLLLSRN